MFGSNLRLPQGCTCILTLVQLHVFSGVGGLCMSFLLEWYSSFICVPCISAYLVQAWDVRNSCKHNGAVLPLSAAPVGRGVDGVDAMA
jgi:hypothetical protein